jgi:hypothetical protein
MTDRTWTPRLTSSWFTGANWQPNGVRAEGDILFVSSGQPTIDGTESIVGETIVLRR